MLICRDLQMLTTNGHSSRLPAGCDDVVHEPGQRRNAADEKGGSGTPVCGILRRIAVDAVEVVHVWNRDTCSANDEVAVDRALAQGIAVIVGRTYSTIKMEVIGPRKIV